LLNNRINLKFNSAIYNIKRNRRKIYHLISLGFFLILITFSFFIIYYGNRYTTHGIRNYSINYIIFQKDNVVEPYNKVWTIKDSGGVNDITWELADWYNPNFTFGSIEENHYRYANGSRILINGNNFVIDYNTDVFLVNESGRVKLKQHFQIIVVYLAVDENWHNNCMDFRGFDLTVGLNKTSEFVVSDGDGESFAKATFQYTNLSYISTNNYTLLNWNVTVPDYKLKNNDSSSQFFNSEVEMSLLILYKINITSEKIEINTDWYIDFLNWTLVNAPNNLVLYTNRVYTCNDIGDLNNEDRIGIFSNGGITTSTFRLENNYTLIYNDTSSVVKNVSSLIENDGTFNGLPENEYWHFNLWFEGFSDNISRFEYDPILTLFTKPFTESTNTIKLNGNWWILIISIFSIIFGINIFRIFFPEKSINKLMKIA